MGHGQYLKKAKVFYRQLFRMVCTLYQAQIWVMEWGVPKQSNKRHHWRENLDVHLHITPVDTSRQ